MDGLLVDPCIPSDLAGFTCSRNYRGVDYHITVDNSAGVQKGIKSVTVNGVPQEDALIRPVEELSTVDVQIVMG